MFSDFIATFAMSEQYCILFVVQRHLQYANYFYNSHAEQAIIYICLFHYPSAP